jgi:hypothetical protein
MNEFVTIHMVHRWLLFNIVSYSQSKPERVAIREVLSDLGRTD